jgi:replicative DNA helicase
LSDAHQRIAAYDKRVLEGEQFGIKMGIPTFDQITMGIQPHEFVVIMAFLGVGKSSLMQSMFYEAYLQGKTPLMINLEMDADSLFRRFDVMATNVRYRAMKALELNEEERVKWEKYAERADEDRHRRDIIVVDDVEGCSVDKVTAAAMRWKPDLVGVDYIGLLDSPRGIEGKGWERLKFISRQLKSTARTMGIPILAAAQANREAGRSGTIALEHTAESIAVAQDCDIMIGLQQDEEQYEVGEMEALLLKNRDEKRTRTLLHWDLSTMNIHERGVDSEGRPNLTFRKPDSVK